MNVVDLLIVAFAIAAAVGGFRLGFLARVASWGGFAVGLYVGARLAPVVVRAVDGGSLVSLLTAAAVVLGAGAVGQAIGFAIGAAFHQSLPQGSARSLDRTSGAVAGALGLLVVVWLLVPALGQLPGVVSRLTRESAVIGFVAEVWPEPPASVQRLRALVTETRFPEVFTDMVSAPETPPPPPASPLAGPLSGRVAASTVNVEAVGCGGIQEGSGFVIEPGLVVTNAHVVAGAEEIEVFAPGGRRVAATAVVFDDDRDLALLRADGLAAPPLGVTEGAVGEAVAIFGHPGGQDALRVAPGTISERVVAEGRDIYGVDRVRRDIFILGARLAPGDSGSAVVDAARGVVGVAFAIAPDRPGTAYALTTAELRAVLSAERSGEVGTGACV